MSGGKSNDQTIGYRYSFSLHMGVCRGPVDSLVEIRVGNKTAWTGNVQETGQFEIDAYDLFGGESGEGGIKGTVDVLMGEPSQLPPASLQTLAGASDVPGFRGVFTMVYDGIVSMINPYPKPWKMRVRRILKGWDGPVFAPQYAAITMDGSASAAGTLGKCASFVSTLRWGYVATINYAPNNVSIAPQGQRAYITYGATPELNHVGAEARTYEGLFRFRVKPDARSNQILGQLSEATVPSKISRACLFGCWGQTNEYVAVVNVESDLIPIINQSGAGWTVDVNAALDRFVIHVNGTSYEGPVLANPLVLGRFYHIAVELAIDGGGVPTFWIYLNGINVWVYTIPQAIAYPWPNNDPRFALTIGSRSDDEMPFDGHIDSFRVTAGRRYNGNSFSPTTQTLPATIDGDALYNSVLLLLNFDGADGSGTITDQSIHGFNPSSVENVTIDPNVPFETVDSLAFAKTDTTVVAMNPAHIIYECLTNRVWGRGYSRALINTESFTEAARILFAEGFGLCIRWTRTEHVRNFIQYILDTIMGSLNVNRTTGQLELTLIRGDYDFNALPLYDEENGILEFTEATVSSPSEGVSEVVVSYRDPVTDTDKKVRATNIAVLQMNGGVPNSQSREYKGIPTATLAMRVAQRDLRAGSLSIRRFSITMDRRGFNLYPGQVIKVRSIARNVPPIAVRIASFEEGNLQDGRIKIAAVQDVFSLPRTTMTRPQGEGWQAPTMQPCLPQHAVFEVPYILLLKGMRPADFNAITQESSRIGAVCAKGQPLNARYDLAVRNGASTPDDTPTTEAYYCGYTPPSGGGGGGGGSTNVWSITVSGSNLLDYQGDALQWRGYNTYGLPPYFLPLTYQTTEHNDLWGFGVKSMSTAMLDKHEADFGPSFNMVRLPISPLTFDPAYPQTLVRLKQALTDYAARGCWVMVTPFGMKEFSDFVSRYDAGGADVDEAHAAAIQAEVATLIVKIAQLQTLHPNLIINTINEPIGTTPATWVSWQNAWITAARNAGYVGPIVVDGKGYAGQTTEQMAAQVHAHDSQVVFSYHIYPEGAAGTPQAPNPLLTSMISEIAAHKTAGRAVMLGELGLTAYNMVVNYSDINAAKTWLTHVFDTLEPNLVGVLAWMVHSWDGNGLYMAPGDTTNMSGWWPQMNMPNGALPSLNPWGTHFVQLLNR